MIQAKQAQTQAQTQNGRFELFTTQMVQDVAGNSVTIPQSIGIYSIEELEQQKNMHLNEIAKIDEKIDAINSIVA